MKTFSIMVGIAIILYFGLVVFFNRISPKK